VCRNLVSCDNIDFCDAGCSNYYRCKNKTCVPISTLCNGILDDGCEEDKEWTSGPGFKCVREGKICSIPQQLVMDGIQDCDDGQDFCYNLNDNQMNKRYVVLAIFKSTVTCLLNFVQFFYTYLVVWYMRSPWATAEKSKEGK